jgi:hypothetical protein
MLMILGVLLWLGGMLGKYQGQPTVKQLLLP